MEERKKEEERVRGVLLNYSPLYNELQLWLQIKKIGIFFFFLRVIICSQVPGWRYDHNRAEGGEDMVETGIEERIEEKKEEI